MISHFRRVVSVTVGFATLTALASTVLTYTCFLPGRATASERSRIENATPGTTAALAEEPIAYIRHLDGAATITNSSSTTFPAERFDILLPGETLTVTAGTAVVVDLRCGASMRVESSPKRFALPERCEGGRRAAWDRLRDALREFRGPSERTVRAATRGGPFSPDQAHFAMAARIVFHWEGVRAVRFKLSGPVSTEVDLSSSDRLEWPAPSRPPGKYRWELFGGTAGHAMLGGGQFEIVDETTKQEQQKRYSEEAAQKFGSALREEGAEILAARDGWFFK